MTGLNLELLRVGLPDLGFGLGVGGWGGHRGHPLSGFTLIRRSNKPGEDHTYPSVRDYHVNADCDQVSLYNTSTRKPPAINEDLGQPAQVLADQEMTIGVDLAGDTAFGNLGLDATAEYYVYDF